MKLKEAQSQPKLSVTFDDKVIVSHPSPEDPQINEEVDQPIRWYNATTVSSNKPNDVYEDRYGQVSSGIYHKKWNKQNKLIWKH